MDKWMSGAIPLETSTRLGHSVVPPSFANGFEGQNRDSEESDIFQSWSVVQRGPLGLGTEWSGLRCFTRFYGFAGRKSVLGPELAGFGRIDPEWVGSGERAR